MGALGGRADGRDLAVSLCLALFLLLAAPWFLAMQARFPEFADYFFVVQHFKRFAQAGFNNRLPFWFFPAVLVVLTLPWSLWLPAAFKSRKAADAQSAALHKLMWVWIIAVTVFFSIPQSKLVGYILPVAAQLAFLIGECASRRIAASARALLLWRASAVLAVTACIAGVVIGGMVKPSASRGLAQELAKRIGPTDSVVFVEAYYFDFSFYAALRSPVLVVQDWTNAAIARRDNWERELHDARRFAGPSGAPVLLQLSELMPTVCKATVTSWLTGSRDMSARYAVLVDQGCRAANRNEPGQRVCKNIHRSARSLRMAKRMGRLK